MSRLGKQAKDIFSSTTPRNPEQTQNPQSPEDNLQTLKAQRERVTFDLFNKAVVIQESSKNFEVRPPLRETTTLRAMPQQAKAEAATEKPAENKPVAVKTASALPLLRETEQLPKAQVMKPALQTAEVVKRVDPVKYFPPELDATPAQKAQAAQPVSKPAVAFKQPSEQEQRIPAAEILRGNPARQPQRLQSVPQFKRRPSVFVPIINKIFSIEAALVLVAVAIQIAILYSLKK